MYQGTTPTYLLTIAGYDLTDAAVFVTLENGSKQITLSGQRLTVTCEAETTSIIFCRRAMGEASAVGRTDVTPCEAWASTPLPAPL